MSEEPLDTVIAGPEGSDRAVTNYVGYGCPTYSVGPGANMLELMLVEAGSVVLNWLQEVALDKDYVNPRVHIFFPEEEEDDGKWPGWDKTEDETKEEETKEEVKKVQVRIQRDGPQPSSKGDSEGIDEELAREMAKRGMMAGDDADSEEES